MGKQYKMINRDNGASITTSESYLIHWLSRGFEIIEIVSPEEEESSNSNEEPMTV